MSKRTLEATIVTLIEKHGLGAVEAAVRMYKVAVGTGQVIKTRKTQPAKTMAAGTGLPGLSNSSGPIGV